MSSSILVTTYKFLDFLAVILSQSPILLMFLSLTVLSLCVESAWSVNFKWKNCPSLLLRRPKQCVPTDFKICIINSFKSLQWFMWTQHLCPLKQEPEGKVSWGLRTCPEIRPQSYTRWGAYRNSQVSRKVHKLSSKDNKNHAFLLGS